MRACRVILSTGATPAHIRLVDCEALVEQETLHVVEFTDNPRVPYSAVSYPWRGVDCDSTVGPTVTVEGAEEADPISTDVLKQACIASLIHGCRYLWLDKLCIIQTDRADKDWHIRHMCRIFKSCAVCLVLPGGVCRLARLEEETPWIHRSWTLLEVVVPRTVFVLFTWNLGWGQATTRSIKEHVREIVPGRSAMAPLYFLLERCVMGFLTFTPFSHARARQRHNKVSLFGAWPAQDRVPGDLPFWRVQYKLFAPHATALATVLAVPRLLEAGETFTNAIWQSALMRTASRPVDMVFSIMGLFGADLDPSTFHEDDLHGATLALVRAILTAGGTPNWLCAAMHFEFNDHVATLPTFPIASPAGPARVRMMGRELEVSQVFGRPVKLNGAVMPFPTCAIGDAGCFILEAGFVRLQAVVDVSAPGLNELIRAVDGSRWSMASNEAGEEHTAGSCAVYGARIGLFGPQFEHISVNADASHHIRIMLLEEHRPGLFHPRSYASFHEMQLRSVLAWPKRTFRIDLPQTDEGTATIGPVICERIICEVPANSSGIGSPFRIFEAASTCRFRLIDCEALVERDTLRIVDFPDIPNIPYKTISYPWRGVSMESTSDREHTFTVEGALNADPIAFNVLKHACTASLIFASRFLWIDTLCIFQTSEEDKLWQIRLMYRVYKSCALCLVFPGGLQRLVRLDEETPWIHRSWTLQEAIAPPTVVVLFAWKLGWAESENLVTDRTGGIREVVPGHSAVAPLSLILNASAEGYLTIRPASCHDHPGILLACCIFGEQPHDGASSTLTSGDGQESERRRPLLAPNVIALAMAMDSNVRHLSAETRSHVVWQSALMRTSSRPVDMILSIMGVFGVSLDPAAFHNDDRRGAAIALAQAILKHGGSASWLGAACGVPPEKTLSTFPSFPHSTVNGAAFIHVNGQTLKVSDLVGTAVYPMDYAGLGPLPKGSMDDAGYLTLSVRAISLRLLATEDDVRKAELAGDRVAEALDGWRWAFDSKVANSGPSPMSSQRPNVFGALLGWTNEYYPGITPLTHDNIRVMVLEEHGPDRFHVRSFFYLSRREVPSILSWPERIFTVGGPVTTDSVPQTVPLKASLPETVSTSHRHPRSSEVLRLQEAALQRVRRALPQHVLERFGEDDLQAHKGEFYIWTGTNVPPEHHNWSEVL